MSSQDTKRFLAITLVIVICYLPLLVMLNGRNEDFMSEENRMRSPFPAIDVRHPAKYFETFKRFFNDNFGFRDALVWLGSNIKVNILSVSPRQQVYFVGKNGWIFYSPTIGDSNETMDEYRGLMPLSEQRLADIRESFENLAALVKKNGGKLYAGFIPNKQTIYPEYLPDHIKRHLITKENRRLNQFYRYMCTCPTVTIIDLESELVNEKNKSDYLLYNPRTDYSHWNMRGAYVAYKKIMERIKQDFKNVPIIQCGDLEFERVAKLQDGDHPLFANMFEWYGKELVPETVHFKNAIKKSELKVIFLGDSCGRNIAPYFEQTFKNILFYRAKHFSRELLEKEKPDIVIWLRVARYVDPVILKDDSLTLPLKIDKYLKELGMVTQ
jgi:alginate O-acetyltransferase complex protein AlgJ